MERKTIRRAVIACTIGAAVLVAVAVGVLKLLKSTIPEETRNLADYSGRLAQWGPSGLVAHFPLAIPANATDARFVEFPGYLQGGSYFQIRMSLSPAQVSAIEATVLNKTVNLPIERRLLMFRVGDDVTQVEPYPDRFTLYVLKANDQVDGNHGEVVGIAISKTTNEVVYWADAW